MERLYAPFLFPFYVCPQYLGVMMRRPSHISPAPAGRLPCLSLPRAIPSLLSAALSIGGVPCAASPLPCGPAATLASRDFGFGAGMVGSPSTPCGLVMGMVENPASPPCGLVMGVVEDPASPLCDFFGGIAEEEVRSHEAGGQPAFEDAVAAGVQSEDSLLRGIPRPVRQALRAEDSLLRAVAVLSGTGEAENLEADEVERYRAYAAKPLKINCCPLSKLLSCGLFSRYQALALADYRSRSGDVLSAAELALVDGFGRTVVEALRPFLSFESRRLPGTVDAKDRLGGQVQAKASVRTGAQPGGEAYDGASYGLKYKATVGEVAEFGLSLRKSYDCGTLFPLETWGLSAALYGRASKLIVGDFNARFGQGLMLWSGFSMDSFSGTSSFCKRGTGLSPSLSFSGEGTHRGVAAETVLGRLCVSAFASLPGLRERMQGDTASAVSLTGGLDAALRLRHALFSLRSFCQEGNALSAALDWRATLRGWDLFGEVVTAFNPSSLKALAGLSAPVGSRARLSAQLRFLEGDEHRAAVGYENGNSCVTAECKYAPATDRRQFKLLAKDAFALSPSLSLTLRLSGRLRDYGTERLRLDLRSDLGWNAGAWAVNVRLNALRCDKFAFLGYAECGRKGESAFLWLRGTWFRTEGWADRIYAYERTAPGNFSVPAYYGHGFAASAYGGLTLARLRGGRCVKAYMRLSMRHPGRGELSAALSAHW